MKAWRGIKIPVVPTCPSAPEFGSGDPAHHYHFQVFALDTVLDTPAGADRDALLGALKGHVLAHGEIVGTFQAPGK